MKRICGLFVLFLSLHCVVAQNTPIPNAYVGVWKLESATVKQILQSGDTLSLPLDEGNYANSTHCVYPLLKFEEKQLVCISDDAEFPIDYTYGDSKVTFWFTAPVEFACESPANNRIALSREYNYYDSETRSLIRLQAHLVYQKQ
jgi:hypothetical protein